MKKALRTILIVILILALLGTGFWYFFLYHSGLPASLYASYAGFLENNGRYGNAARFYSKAMDLEPGNIDLALKAADAYRLDENYTKAEYVLVRSIAQNQEALDLYLALSSVYVEQDKLLDAERLISACANETVKEALAGLRPAAPVIQPDGGFSLEPVAFSLSYAGGSAYYSLSDEYPSLGDDPYAAPVDLDYGVTTVSAIVVGENGLVSPLVTAEFTVCGEISEVVFQDEDFEAMVRDLLNKGAHAEILSTELWTISELTIPAEIANLSDLANFVGLKTLSLENSAATDFSALASLPALSTLNLTGCQLSSADLEAIGAISSLTELHLRNCGVTSLGALAGLTELTVLDVASNSVSDISALAGMPALQEVYLSGNQITSITPLTAATQLTVLDLSGNQFGSLGAISANTALVSLTASSCGITDLSPLENKAAMTTLDLSSNQITDVGALQNCTALTDLKLASNQITDLTPITGLTGLQNLDASSNLLTQSPRFAEDCALLTLNLSLNQLTEVDGLTALYHLNYLCVNNNRLTDLSAISLLPTLIQVDALQNPLVGVTSLEEHSIIVNYDPGYTLPEEEPEEDAQDGEAGTESTPSGESDLQGQVQDANGG